MKYTVKCDKEEKSNIRFGDLVRLRYGRVSKCDVMNAVMTRMEIGIVKSRNIPFNGADVAVVFPYLIKEGEEATRYISSTDLVRCSKGTSITLSQD